ncbi:protein arginine kinase [Cohnella silvisoli]|uniref:Protein-arginine kinase n=1 Tax=Cohnella silvisoli TaxID=2873699 RepID=A0ABV1L4B0_9BACL|nr:protein arginine kinase [Cohnella silvisoli]MCD9026322.1 protein arginine kinase [Cohnella silvisoli]
MVKRKFVKQALSQWMNGEGADSDVVLSSRVRIARNVRNLPFPMMADPTQSLTIMEQLLGVAESGRLNGLGKIELIRLSDLTELEKLVLVEKHLISPSLANESRNGALILSPNEDISIMINEEDHLRIQCLCSGFQVREAWDLASKIDDIFEEQVDYAFDEKHGFLTSCPTNVGTGIRASVMMHLPALVMTGQINRILSAVTQVGLAVRGLYGEGSEATGNLFQVSNQITLGQSEQEIIENLFQVARQMIEHEKSARSKLITESRPRVEDRIRRSYGILTQAIIMDTKEASQRLSDIRLGAHLGLLPELNDQILNELLVSTQPGFLQQTFGEALSPEQRDMTRAELIRSRLATTS